MDLYLIRHAEAVALGERGVASDDQRPLTERGERQSIQLAKFLKKREIWFGKVVSSPFVRARQTAEIILANLGGPLLEIVLTPDLQPDAKPKLLAKFLRKQNVESLALVSHMPFIAEFTAWLIGSKRAQIDFEKAGIAHLSTHPNVDKGTGTLHWLLTPDFI